MTHVASCDGQGFLTPHTERAEGEPRRKRAGVAGKRSPEGESEADHTFGLISQLY